MAEVELIRGGRRVVARDEAERALLAHARAGGGELPLCDALYMVRDDALLLPAEISAGAAQRVCLAFEAAARSHREAEARRGRFKLL